MFCDLVSSTELGSRLDPEDFGEVVNRYYQMCSEVITSHGGYLANYLGDGVLAYFGYPAAQEDSAQQAARAALAVQRASTTGPEGETLPMRIGINTGVVMVDDVGGNAQAGRIALGGPMNVAARVESLAQPGEVLATETTYRLIEGAFQLTDRGSHQVKGLAEPIRVYRVDAEVPRGRGRRVRPRASTFVGRRSELEALASAWSAARTGHGQVVVIEGEPGIGKSRLVAEFGLDLASGPPGEWIQVDASPLLDRTPFGLIRDVLSEIAEVPDVAGLLDGEGQPGLSLNPEQRRKQIIARLTSSILASADRAPAALVIEDLHWADPTSVEVLAAVLEESARKPLLVVFTVRPGFVFPWPQPANHRRLVLPRLSPPDTAAIIRSVIGDAPAADLVESVVSRSDGVPLFAEELAKKMGDDPGVQRAVPLTLYDVLMTRIDGLGPAKRVAQIAAVIGRDFDAPLLEAVAELPSDEVDRALARLSDLDIAADRGNGSYRFRHALIQEAAYDSLLRRDRVDIHRRIAEELTCDIAPYEVVAHHLTEANELERAAAAWQEAARRAAARSSHVEAVAHSRLALDLLARLPDNPCRAQSELVSAMRIHASLQITKGFGAPETMQSAEQARALTERLDDDRARVKALYGLWSATLSAGRLNQAHDLAMHLMSVAEGTGDETLIMLADCAQAGALLNLADLPGAIFHARRVLDLGGSGPKQVMAALYGAAAASVMGRIRLARKWTAQLREWADSPSSSPIITILAMQAALVPAVWLREFEEVEINATRLREYGLALDLPIFTAWADIYGGWALAHRGDPNGGASRVEEGVTIHIGMDQLLGINHSLGLLAEAQLLAGKCDQGLDALRRAEAYDELAVQRQHTLELHRLRGVLSSAMGGKDYEVEYFLRASLGEATDIDARLLVLRTSTDLARWLADHHRRDEARALLVSALEAVDQEEQADIADAEMVLAALAL